MEEKNLEITIGNLVKKARTDDVFEILDLLERLLDVGAEETESIARVLMELMKEGTHTVSVTAEALLGCLTVDAISIVAAALRNSDPLWRQRILGVLWRLSDDSTAEYMKQKGAQVIPYLVLMLDDQYLIEYSDEEDIRDEPEYLELRICDESYLLLADLHGEYIEQYYFSHLNYEDRDEVINDLKKRYSGISSYPVS